MQYKVCSKCHIEKSIRQFYRKRIDSKSRHVWCKSCTHNYLQKYRVANAPTYFRNKHLREKYGLTSDDWDTLFIKQSGLCAICGNWLKFDKSTHIDHSHKTGRVRSLLCHSCNTGIGNLRESPFIMEKAIEYLNAA